MATDRISGQELLRRVYKSLRVDDATELSLPHADIPNYMMHSDAALLLDGKSGAVAVTLAERSVPYPTTALFVLDVETGRRKTGEIAAGIEEFIRHHAATVSMVFASSEFYPLRAGPGYRNWRAVERLIGPVNASAGVDECKIRYPVDIAAELARIVGGVITGSLLVEEPTYDIDDPLDDEFAQETV